MSDDLSGFSMFELFKAEAETQAAALNEGLLAIESSPDDLAQIEKLMRAAHSAKGAARIIGLDPVVALAHAMEDCFVAVQKGQEKLTSGRVDQLLKGVDVLERIAALSEQEAETWLQSSADSLEEIATAVRQPAPDSLAAATPPAAEPQPEQPPADRETSEGRTPPESKVSEQKPPNLGTLKRPPAATEAGGALQSVTTRTGVSVRPIESAHDAEQPPADRSAAQQAPAEKPVRAESAPSPPEPTASLPSTRGGASAGDAAAVASDERAVPVNSRNLNRIMRLASESMIESRRFQDMSDSIASVRDAYRQIGAWLDDHQRTGDGPRSSQDSVCELRALHEILGRQLQQHTANLDQVGWRGEQLSAALYHEVIAARMRPFAEGTTAFPRMIRDLARSLGKQVSFEVVGGTVAVDRDILRRLEAPLNHFLRNCVDHGIETPQQRRAVGKPDVGRVVLEARHHAGMLTIQVRDDGRGIETDRLREEIVKRELADESMAASMRDAELLEFLFLPGFSTTTKVTEVSGRGVGLDVVRCMVQEVSGTVRVESQPGRGTVFTLHLPVTLSVIRAAMVEIGGEPYAFPLSRLERIVRVPMEEITPVQGKQQFVLDGQSVGLVDAAEIFGLGPVSASDQLANVVVIGEPGQRCGLVVERFIGEQDVVVRPLDRRLGKVPHISAAAVLQSGDPLLIVDVEDLFQSVQQMLADGRLRGMTSVVSQQSAHSRPRVLVVDDSITVREVVRHLLVTHGYDVDVAVDGQDGWNALCSARYDLLITDVDMPRLNGIELIRAAHQDRRFADLPIIIVSYKDREQDRLLGLEVGANAYLTKGSFHDDSLMTTVEDLIGDTR